jgi:ADP-ribose pyrophosphatase
MTTGAHEPEAVDRKRTAYPQLVSSRLVYEGKIITMRVDEISLPQGGFATREVVEHPGAVVIIAIDEQERVYFVRQYRHAIRSMLLELPAGTLEPDEEPLGAAKRELREEVGLVAEEWHCLGSFYSSPGFVNEHLHVFLARQLRIVESQPDFDEDLVVVRMQLSQLSGRLVDITDAKSLAALHLLQGDSDHGYRT